jgi:hypothetical protein
VSKRTHKDKDDVLRLAFAFFHAHARHNLSPTSRDWSNRMAGECLWALGVKEFDGHKAKRPEAFDALIEGVAILPISGPDN